MPLYAFACQRCDAPFEELQRIDASPPPCPSCGATDVRRLLSSFLAGPGRTQPSTFTPAATRRDHIGGCHGHAH